MKSAISHQLSVIRTRKSSVYSLILLVLLTALCALHPVPFAYATEASPSADLQSKLKALQTEIASKAAKLKTEVNKKLQNRAYIGTIINKSDNTLFLQTKSGNKSVSTNEFTEYLPVKQVTLKSLVKDDFLVALGDVDQDGVLTAKRIVELKGSSAERVVNWGQVTEKNSKSLTIKTLDGSLKTASISAQTIFRMGQESAVFDDIRINKAVVLVTTSDKEIMSARFVYILPYSLKLKAKEASASATPKPTPTPKTASPSASAKTSKSP